jgi:hypothetical protein
MQPIVDASAYEDALVATERLLRQVSMDYWADWLLKDLKLWRTEQDISHHLLAYGGMGSFNDIYICRSNSHHITTEQEPWAHLLFDWLKALLFHLTHSQPTTLTIDGLRRTVGRDIPSLSAFVGGKNAPPSWRGYWYPGSTIRVGGRRCKKCGYAYISAKGLQSIDSAIAESIIPELVFHACVHHRLTELVDSVLALNIPEHAQQRKQLEDAAQASNISLTQDGRMCPCPQCGSEEISVCNWVYQTCSKPYLKESHDNLWQGESAITKWLQYNCSRLTAGGKIFISYVCKLFGREPKR